MYFQFVEGFSGYFTFGCLRCNFKVRVNTVNVSCGMIFFQTQPCGMMGIFHTFRCHTHNHSTMTTVCILSSYLQIFHQYFVIIFASILSMFCHHICKYFLNILSSYLQKYRQRVLQHIVPIRNFGWPISYYLDAVVTQMQSWAGVI